MKPASFEYRVAANLGHAVALFDATPVGAKALAPGQSPAASPCRGTGYEGIVRAIESAAGSMKGRDG